MRCVPSNDRLIIVGDFNARVGSDLQKYKGVLGSHGVGKCDANGEVLLSLCSEYNLVVTNTLFKHTQSIKKKKKKQQHNNKEEKQRERKCCYFYFQNPKYVSGFWGYLIEYNQSY